MFDNTLFPLLISLWPRRLEVFRPLSSFGNNVIPRSWSKNSRIDCGLMGRRRSGAGGGGAEGGGGTDKAGEYLE